MSGFIDGARFFILEIILDYKFAESNQDVIILEAIKSKFYRIRLCVDIFI